MAHEEQKQELTFEEAMTKLEQIVEKLEEGDVPLEKAIAYYEEGMKLSKFCSDKLTDVQKQMTQYLNEQGQLEPFDIVEEE